MQLFGRTLRGAIKRELAGVIRAELCHLGHAHHRAIEEYGFIVAANRQPMPNAETVVSRLKSDFDDLALLHANGGWVVSPGAFGNFDAHVRFAAATNRCRKSSSARTKFRRVKVSS
jgi:hypothetical protein